MGTYVSASSQMAADYVYQEVIESVGKESLAHKIMSSSNGEFSEKQLWVIAYELMKNEAYVSKLADEIEYSDRKATAKAEASKSKLTANKEGSQNVLDYVKSNGRNLSDYYTFVKKNKSFAKEFYSKKFSMDSANEFLNN